MRISDWSSDVCSSDLYGETIAHKQAVQMDIANSYIEYMQFRLLVLYTAWMFDQQQEHGREGRKMISAVKAAMAKIAQDVVTRAVHLDRKSTRLNSSH